MARHNREARGVDQHGDLWTVSYQPDWLRWVKISRELPDGRRRSTKTLFRNPARRAEDEPGKVIRTRVVAADGSAEFQVALEDRTSAVEEVVVELKKPRGRKKPEVVRFHVRGGMPPPVG